MRVLENTASDIGKAELLDGRSEKRKKRIERGAE